MKKRLYHLYSELSSKISDRPSDRKVFMKKREPEIRSCLIKDLSEKDRDRLLIVLHSFSEKNVKSISRDYLARRMKGYKIITLIYQGTDENPYEEILGFAFSSIYFLSGLFLKIPVFHCGLTLLAKNFRGRGLSLAVCASLYKLIVQQRMIGSLRILLTGILFTAKCSSPVSFLKIRRVAYQLSWPKIKDEDSLSFLSRTKLSRALSRALSCKLAGPDRSSDDFILRGINAQDFFQLEAESFSFEKKQDKEAVRFFKRHIMPWNELITIAWFHPLVLCLQRRKALVS